MHKASCLRRPLLLLALVAALLVLPAPAFAAPSNDTVPGARQVTGIPYVDRTDTTGAVAGVIGGNTCYGNEGSVFYQYAPTTDRTLDIDTRESDYFAPLVIYRRTATGLQLVSDPCDRTAQFTFRGGSRYVIMVSDPYTQDGVGGALVFRMRGALTMTVVIGAEGTVSHASGEAAVPVTVTCSRPVTGWGIEARVRQRINDTTLVTGSGAYYPPTGSPACTPTPTRFVIAIEPSGTVPFKAGGAAVRVTGSACDISCTSASVGPQVIPLRWVT